jgi:hypothetical protein
MPKGKAAAKNRRGQKRRREEDDDETRSPKTTKRTRSNHPSEVFKCFASFSELIAANSKAVLLKHHTYCLKTAPTCSGSLFESTAAMRFFSETIGLVGVITKPYYKC